MLSLSGGEPVSDVGDAVSIFSTVLESELGSPALLPRSCKLNDRFIAKFLPREDDTLCECAIEPHQHTA